MAHYSNAVSQKIAADPVFTEVMLASRTKSKCDAVAAAIGGDRVQTVNNLMRICIAAIIFMIKIYISYNQSLVTNDTI